MHGEGRGGGGGRLFPFDCLAMLCHAMLCYAPQIESNSRPSAALHQREESLLQPCRHVVEEREPVLALSDALEVGVCFGDRLVLCKVGRKYPAISWDWDVMVRSTGVYTNPGLRARRTVPTDACAPAIFLCASAVVKFPGDAMRCKSSGAWDLIFLSLVCSVSPSLYISPSPSPLPLPSPRNHSRRVRFRVKSLGSDRGHEEDGMDLFRVRRCVEHRLVAPMREPRHVKLVWQIHCRKALQFKGNVSGPPPLLPTCMGRSAATGVRTRCCGSLALRCDAVCSALLSSALFCSCSQKLTFSRCSKTQASAHSGLSCAPVRRCDAGDRVFRPAGVGQRSL